MSPRVRSLTCIALILAAGPVLPAADPPRVRPTGATSIGIKPWETASSSPWGWSRMGGIDRRQYAVSPDGRLIATEDAGGWQIELWDVAGGVSLGRFGRIEDPAVFAFAPDGRTLVSVGNPRGGSLVELWDVSRQQRLRDLDEGVNSTVFTCVAWSPDGRTVALGARADRQAPLAPAIHVWDTSTGDEVRTLAPVDVSHRGQRQRRDPVYDCLAFTPDGRTLAAVAEGRVWLWEVASGESRGPVSGWLPGIVERETHWDGPDEGLAASLAISPDGRTVAAGCRDGAVRQWDLVTGREQVPLVGHAGPVRAVWYVDGGRALRSFGADNRVLTWPKDGPHREWRPPTGPLTDADLAALLEAVAGGDPVAGYAATARLVAAPDRSVPFLARQVKPVPTVDAERINQLVANLENADFNTRKQIARELRAYGRRALPALAEQYGDLQTRLREELIARPITAAQRQQLIALLILGRCDTAASRAALADVARGAADAAETRIANRVIKHSNVHREQAAVKFDPAALWTELSRGDAAQVFAQMRRATADPVASVAALRSHLGEATRRAGDESPERIGRLIAELDRSEFPVREAATRELTGLGRVALPAVEKALAGGPSPEARRRLETIARDIRRYQPTPEQLQWERAVELLELIRTPAAREALEAAHAVARPGRRRDALAAALLRLGPMPTAK